MDSDILIAIKKLRLISKMYLEHEIDFKEFYNSISILLGNEFDPLMDSIKDFNKCLQHEIKLYSRFSGGEFGEYEQFIPQKENWAYGDNNEDYGWIDQEKYYDLFKKEYLNIKLDRLSD